jgi:hypothetical protein
MEIVRINAFNDISEMKSIQSNLTEIEYDILRNFHDTFHFYEESHNVMYAIIDSPKLDRLKTFYNNYSINYEITNITKDVLYGLTKLDGSSDFKDGVYDFIKDCLTVDIILDKISELGIDTLTDYDKGILENYK